jgi:hypothetical protein
VTPHSPKFAKNGKIFKKNISIKKEVTGQNGFNTYFFFWMLKPGKIVSLLSKNLFFFVVQCNNLSAV